MTLAIVTAKTKRLWPRKPDWPYTINWDSPQAQGLVLCWSGDPAGSRTTMFDLVRGRNGTLTGTGGPTWNALNDPRYGQIGLSFVSASSQYVTSGLTLASVLGKSSGAFSARVVAKSTNTATRQAIGGAATSGFGLRGFVFEFSGFGQTSRSISVVGTGAGTGGYLNSGVIAADNTFYDMVVTWTGASRVLYVDGLSKNSDAVGWSDGGSTNLGRGGDNAGLYLNGEAPFMQIWNAPLPAPVVWSLYDPSTCWDLYYQLGQRSWFLPSTETPTPAAFNAAWMLNCNKLLGGGVY